MSAVRKPKEAVLADAVFLVQNAKHSTLGQPETIAHIVYVRIQPGVKRKAVIAELTMRLFKRYGTTNVRFKFWADTFIATGGTALNFTPQGVEE